MKTVDLTHVCALAIYGYFITRGGSEEKFLRGYLVHWKKNVRPSLALRLHFIDVVLLRSWIYQPVAKNKLTWLIVRFCRQQLHNQSGQMSFEKVVYHSLKRVSVSMTNSNWCNKNIIIFPTLLSVCLSFFKYLSLVDKHSSYMFFCCFSHCTCCRSVLLISWKSDFTKKKFFFGFCFFSQWLASDLPCDCSQAHHAIFTFILTSIFYLKILWRSLHTVPRITWHWS